MLKTRSLCLGLAIALTACKLGNGGSGTSRASDSSSAAPAKPASAAPAKSAQPAASGSAAGGTTARRLASKGADAVIEEANKKVDDINGRFSMIKKNANEANQNIDNAVAKQEAGDIAGAATYGKRCADQYTGGRENYVEIARLAKEIADANVSKEFAQYYVLLGKGATKLAEAYDIQRRLCGAFVERLPTETIWEMLRTAKTEAIGAEGLALIDQAEKVEKDHPDAFVP